MSYRFPDELEYESALMLTPENMRPKLSVYKSVSSTGSYSFTFPHEQRELLFSNDADKETPPLQLDTSATVRVTGPNQLDFTFTVYYGEVLDERLSHFTTIEITSNYRWRFLTRSGAMP